MLKTNENKRSKPQKRNGRYKVKPNGGLRTEKYNIKQKLGGWALK